MAPIFLIPLFVSLSGILIYFESGGEKKIDSELLHFKKNCAMMLLWSTLEMCIRDSAGVAGQNRGSGVFLPHRCAGDRL